MEANSIRVVARLIFLFVFFGPMMAQDAQPGPSSAEVAKSRVAGIVVSSIDGHPLARALIVLTNTKNASDRQTALSSEDGHFEFKQVAKGKFSLQGSKPGFIAQAYDQHEQFSTAIVTSTDIPTEDLILRLVPAAALSVKIIDESGEPVRKASIMLYREDRSSGISRIENSRSGSTDDLGACDFARIPPGTYFIGVTATPWYAMHPNGPIDNRSGSESRQFDVVYPPTYYGDTTEPDSAVPIGIKGGEQVEAEIRLSPVPALHLIFRAPENGSHGSVTPFLRRMGFDGADMPVMGGMWALSADSVEIGGISPGRYKVNLPGSAPTEINIANDGQDLSQIRGEALGSVKASVRVLGEAKLPHPLFVQLRGDDGKPVSGGAVDEKGEVNFADVPPGQYNIFAGSGGKNYFVVKVSSQSQSSDHSLNVPAGTALEVSLSLIGDTVNLEGFAKREGKAAAGAMVVLVPKNPEQNRELFRRDQSDLDGSFELRDVAPGTYSVIAVANGWHLDWSMPAVIEPYLKNGQNVVIGTRGGKSVTLPTAVEVTAAN